MQNENNTIGLNWHLISMTGLGQAQLVHQGIAIEAIVKSVNQRGFDIKCRFPEELLYLEAQFSTILWERLERGRIEAYVNIDFLAQPKSSLVIDEIKAEALIHDVLKLSDRFGELLPPSMGDILALPGVVKVIEQPMEKDIDAQVIQAFGDALNDLMLSRKHEGAALSEAIRGLFIQVVALIDAIEHVQEQDILKRFDRFKTRMDELFKGYGLSEDRLYQECALLIERSDIKEEIDRLKAHVQYFDALCTSKMGKGRKLDFLCQEMLRESNTLMSKACSSAVTIKAIDLKAQIERIREQVQNIE